MKSYVDTSVLVSLYIPDANSPQADAWRQANPAAIDFTGPHRIELRNALGLAVFQQRLKSRRECRNQKAIRCMRLTLH